MTDEPWIVMRWSGREGDAHRKVFEGTEEKARRKYDKLHAEMRQGGVELIDGDGKTVKRDRASRRTQSSLTLVIECDRLRAALQSIWETTTDGRSRRIASEALGRTTKERMS